jgi:hypothetical protein
VYLGWPQECRRGEYRCGESLLLIFESDGVSAQRLGTSFFYLGREVRMNSTQAWVAPEIEEQSTVVGQLTKGGGTYGSHQVR